MLLTRLLPLVGFAMAGGAGFNNGSNIDCVYGVPFKNGNFVMDDYANVKFSFSGGIGGLIGDYDFLRDHSVMDPLTKKISRPMFPYGEYKCQFTCNSNPDCVSFMAYIRRNSNDKKGELVCHFFDTLIHDDVVHGERRREKWVLSHAYNRLCQPVDWPQADNRTVKGS